MKPASARPAIALLAALLASAPGAPCRAQEGAKAHIAVSRLSNETGTASYDAACQAVTDTLLLTLRELGSYEVQAAEPRARGDEGLRAMAEERRLDFVMYGRMSQAAGGGIACSLSVYDRAKGKTTLSKQASAAGALDVFDAADQLAVSVLESLTGSHIGFGSIRLRNGGEKGAYSVLVDGYPAGRDLAGVDKVLNGRRTVAIVQRRMLGDREIAKASVTVREGETATFDFSLPYLMPDEQAEVEGLKSAIASLWGDARAAARTEASIAELAALLADVSYCPRLSSLKDEAVQLQGEWALRKTRLAVEAGAWEPDPALLDEGGTVYAGAKKYPNPKRSRDSFEESAQLESTLLELAAGKALAAGDAESAGAFFEKALVLASRYQGGKRLTDFAFAVTTLKELSGSGGDFKAQRDLKAVFGPWMRAGQRFYELRPKVEAGEILALVGTDFGTPLAVEDGEAAEAPLGLEAALAAKVLSVRPKGATPLELSASPGSRLLLARDGFAAFGKPLSASAANAQGRGLLNLTSVPPGVSVVVDEGDPVQTPVSLELAPGSHSIQPQGGLINQLYYLDQPKQWVSVPASGEMDLSIKMEAGRSQIVLKLAPPGYKVSVNGEAKGITPLEPFDVAAGVYSVNFEKDGDAPHGFMAVAMPDSPGVIAWGERFTNPIQLERRAIKLDGKPDSWGEIQPLYESQYSTYFLSEAGYGVQRVYACRDDKYFYWRLDFFKDNPLYRLPLKTANGVATQLDLENYEPRKNLNLNLTRNKQRSETRSSMGIWDDVKRSFTTLSQDGAFATKESPSMFVGRIELARLAKYAKGPARLVCRLAEIASDGQWMHQTSTMAGWVDITK
jgi:hypothetical protein